MAQLNRANKGISTIRVKRSTSPPPLPPPLPTHTRSGSWSRASFSVTAAAGGFQDRVSEIMSGDGWQRGVTLTLTPLTLPHSPSLALTRFALTNPTRPHPSIHLFFLIHPPSFILAVSLSLTHFYSTKPHPSPTLTLSPSLTFSLTLTQQHSHSRLTFIRTIHHFFLFLSIPVCMSF